MTGKKILAGAGLAIVGVLILGFLYLAIADFSRFRPNIETAVSDALGREFTRFR